MPLVTVSDYQLLVNQILYYMDNNFSGIDHYGFPIYAGILPEDFMSVITTYDRYKTTRDARATAVEVHPTQNGANETVFSSGGSPQTTF